MSAQAVVLAASWVTFPGAVSGPLAVRLQNEDSIGVLVKSLHFHSLAGAASFNVKLSYNGLPITNGWIPVHSFCWPRAEFTEAGVGPELYLSQPIYLGPGEWIDVSFSRDPLLVAGITVTASAHAIQAPTPMEKWLPYLTYFQGAQRNVNTDAGTFSEVSTPQDLGNPFDNDLHIERLVARVLSPLAVLGGALFTATPTPYGQFFVVTLSDDRDNLWIGDPTPIYTAFNVATRSWKLNAVLPPKGYLRAQIEGVATGYTAPANFDLGVPLLGMVGYRRIFG
jgi:hypothetical protein